METNFIPEATQAYLKSISNIPLLTAEEEQRLTVLVKQGDSRARERMIQSNLKLVVSIAKGYLNNSKLSFLDLIQEGNTGLIEAVDRFNPELGYRFSTYATYWIKQAIGKASNSASRVVRIPANMMRDITAMNRTSKELTQALLREPTTAEIAEAIGVPEEKIKKLKLVISDPVSMDLALSEDDDATLGDLIADPDAVGVAQEMIEEEKVEAIDAVLGSLSERERQVLILRHGLRGTRPTTLEEIGKQFGLSKERIRQIEEDALRKLRNPIRAERLKIYLEG